MNEKINFPVALLHANDLAEAIVALKYDQRFPVVHREGIEQSFVSLAKELGFSVSPVGQLVAAE